MMTIAYTRMGAKAFRNKTVLSPISVPRQIQVAHVPEGTGYTLCGRRIAITTTVEDDSEVRTCQICVKRLHVIEKKNPQRLRNLLAPPG